MLDGSDNEIPSDPEPSSGPEARKLLAPYLDEIVNGILDMSRNANSETVKFNALKFAYEIGWGKAMAPDKDKLDRTFEALLERLGS